MQVLEQEQEQKLKLSKMFYDADKEGIRQVQGMINDGKGGYCALGLITHYLGLRIFLPDVDDAVDKYNNTYKTSLVVDNDYHNLSWKEFGDRFAAIGL